MAKAAQRCIMAALDHSRAPAIALIDESGPHTEPTIKLPPQALRLIAQVLGAMGERRPITIVPTKHEFTTVEAAHHLNVSRPFVIKEIEAGKLKCGGQVISDTAIGFLAAMFRSKTAGGRLPNTELIR